MGDDQRLTIDCRPPVHGGQGSHAGYDFRNESYRKIHFLVRVLPAQAEAEAGSRPVGG